MNTAITKTKVSDLPATTLRLQAALLDQLKREATINRRSLNMEIEERLVASFQELEEKAQRNAMVHGHYVTEPGKGKDPAPALSELQRLLLSHFNAMPPEKQLALLTVLKR